MVSHNKQTDGWQDFVRCFSEAFAYGQQISLRNSSKPVHKKSTVLSKNGPKIIICSPHPDDECLTGTLPLRLQREANASVLNLAITLGSAISRQKERLLELKEACEVVGFTNRLVVNPLGFSRVTVAERHDSPQKWLEKVKIIAEHFQEIGPDLLCMPHSQDGHHTHEAVSLLVSDALIYYSQQAKRQVVVAESEFWRPSTTPKLLIGVDDVDLALLVAGVAKHRGEIMRNPYHLRMPARLMNNVQRGGELICGSGKTPPDFCFGELYDLCLYDKGERRPWPNGKLIFPPGIEIDFLKKI